MINIYDFICANAAYFDQLKFGNTGSIFIDYLCPIKENKTRAWSHMNCLMYVCRGKKGYGTIDHIHRSKPHDVLFVRKGGVVLHQYFENPYRALIFMFDDSAIHGFFSEYPSLMLRESQGAPILEDLPTVTSVPSSSFVQSAFLSSLEYLKSPADENRVALEIKFKELLVSLLRERGPNSFNHYLSTICSDKAASFIKLMRDNGHFHFTTSELARLAGMSLSTFKREFTRHFGVSPGKWLREQRMARAVAMLSQNRSVSEVAFELGYSDAAAFSRAFKQTTNRSPSDVLGSDPN
jgi:AraC-like DNA-binding protein